MITKNKKKNQDLFQNNPFWIVNETFSSIVKCIYFSLKKPAFLKFFKIYPSSCRTTLQVSLGWLPWLLPQCFQAPLAPSEIWKTVCLYHENKKTPRNFSSRLQMRGRSTLGVLLKRNSLHLRYLAGFWIGVFLVFCKKNDLIISLIFLLIICLYGWKKDREKQCKVWKVKMRKKKFYLLLNSS